MSVEAYLVEGVHVRLRPSKTAPGTYLAVAKHEPFNLAGIQIAEPGDVWFEFGTDKAQLVDNLVAEVKAASL